MKHSDVKLGMKVVPHGKTADWERLGGKKPLFEGLENSHCWKEAKEKGQPYLYVTRIYPYPHPYPTEYSLGVEKGRTKGDYFLIEDFEAYVESDINAVNKQTPK